MDEPSPEPLRSPRNAEEPLLPAKGNQRLLNLINARTPGRDTNEMTQRNKSHPDGKPNVLHDSPRGYGVTNSGVGICPPIGPLAVAEPLRGLRRHDPKSPHGPGRQAMSESDLREDLQKRRAAGESLRRRQRAKRLRDIEIGRALAAPEGGDVA